MESLQPTLKSFWAKPEGKTGIIFLLGLGVVAWFYIVPYVITLLQNTLYAAFLGGILLLIVACLMNRNFRTGVWYGFKMLMRKFTGLIVNIDPIAIMEIYIADLRKKREEMREQITLLDVQLKSITKALTEAMEGITNSAGKKEAAVRIGDAAAATFHTQEAGRFEREANKYKPIQNQMKALKTILLKMYDNSDYAIRNLDSEVQSQKRQYKVIKAGHNALRSAMSIFRGDPDKLAMFEQAQELIQADIHLKAAEMDSFIRESSTFIKEIDLQNDADLERGLQILNERADRNLQILLAPVGQGAAIPLAPAGTTVLERPKSFHQMQNEFDHLLNDEPKHK